MNTDTSNAATQLLFYGIIFAIVKMIASFLDPYNILDFIIFLLVGLFLGKKVPRNQMGLGLLLALPAFLLCLFFVVRLGFTSIVNGIGTAYAISLVVIPLATILGLFIHAKRTPKGDK